jgi:pimeloyl-ACP methyl ester carboxylesterase
MPQIKRPDGATIYYEVHGSGYPILLFAPGGVNSQIESWRTLSPINAIDALQDRWTVIAMDQRNAGRSFGPLTPFSYELAVGDQLAVLDDLGIERCHLMGGCIGVAFVLRFIMTAPGRVASAVCQKPVGLDETNSMDTFTAMFRPTIELARASGMAAVVESALNDPMFSRNNAAGPWALRLKHDEDFGAQFLAQTPDGYADLVGAYCDGVWPSGRTYFGVPDVWVKDCATPLLVLPGSDDFHPTGVARRLAREVQRADCLDPDWLRPENVPGSTEVVRDFLQSNTPNQ